MRGDASLRRNLSAALLGAGDRAVLCTPMSEVPAPRQSGDLRPVDKLSSMQTTRFEAMITPG